MDETYLSRKPKNWLGTFAVLLVFILIVAGALIFVGGRKNLVSPIPKEPTFKVIFYTPTPEPVTPTSTPSATPKVKTASTATPKPSPKDTGTPTPKATVSPTVKPTS